MSSPGNATATSSSVSRPGSSEQATLRTSAKTPSYGPITAGSNFKPWHRFEAGCYRSLHNVAWTRAIDANPCKRRQNPTRPLTTIPAANPRQSSNVASARNDSSVSARITAACSSPPPWKSRTSTSPWYSTWALGIVKGRLHRARGELIDVLRTNTYDWELSA